MSEFLVSPWEIALGLLIATGLGGLIGYFGRGWRSYRHWRHNRRAADFEAMRTGRAVRPTFLDRPAPAEGAPNGRATSTQDPETAATDAAPVPEELPQPVQLTQRIPPAAGAQEPAAESGAADAARWAVRSGRRDLEPEPDVGTHRPQSETPGTEVGSYGPENEPVDIQARERDSGAEPGNPEVGTREQETEPAGTEDTARRLESEQHTAEIGTQELGKEPTGTDAGAHVAQGDRHNAQRDQRPADLPDWLPSVSTSSEPSTRAPARTTTVLLVDDRYDLLAIHGAFLEQHGYRVLTAADGEYGLELARSHHPSVILLDHSLPRRSGIEIARDLKRDPATADIPIVLMTAHSYGAVGSSAMAAGCTAFLAKPCDPNRVLKEVVRLVPAEGTGGAAGGS